ncbi:MAG: efflux RND transporter permease subunit [Bacteroidales bacterium]|nr:efflux RND transporter permease subunit [Candidatus Cryptobacteroides aphodequi]
MKISDLSIKRPIYVIVLFLVVAILGFLGYSSMKAELMPKFTPPSLNVQVIYPGASPSEVESSLTVKLEDVLSSMSGVESMRSYSFEGMSMVFVSFTYGTDIEKAMTDAQNKIAAKRAELPSAILSPIINEISVDSKSVMTLSLSSSLDAVEFTDLIKQRILPELQRIPGMAKVESVGERDREVQINMDMAVMRELGITPVQVLGAIKGANLDFPTGSIQDGRTHTSVRLSGKLTSVEEIRSLVLMTLPNGTQIRMSDIADVVETAADVKTLARVNGKDAVLINIFKQEDANAIDLSDDVAATVEKLEQRYEDVNLEITTVSDSSDFTRESIKSVLEDLLIAILLVTIVILVFLHNWRNALIVMLAVPLSLIGSFIGMKLFNFTLNIMSLLGLSVVIGVLVDDAIVVIENVCRHMEMGKSALQATKDAMQEIGYTVITVTIVLVIVFLPIALTNSLVSDILRQFCGVVIFSILFSLLASLTIVPLLTSRYGKQDVLDPSTAWGKIMIWFEKVVQSFGDWVSGVLKKCLGHKRWVGIVIIALTVLICSLFPMGFIGFEFMPKVDQSEFSVLLEMPKDISIEESSLQVARAEAWLLNKPEITEVVSMIGLTSSNNESNQGTPYLAELKVKMVPPAERDQSVHIFISGLRRQLTDFLVDAKVKVFAASLHGAGNSADIEYVLSGAKADSVALFGEYALEAMKEVPGTMQQQLSTGSGRPEVEVVVDREKMSALGLSLDNVGLTLQMAFQGNSSMKYVKDDYEYDINIRADHFYRSSIDDVANLSFINQQGNKVTLDQFAQVRIGTGPNRLERYNRNPSVTISANVVGVSSGEASGAFLDKVSEKADQMDVSIETVGDMKSMMDSMSVFAIAILLSIILMYLALVILYNNWSDPLVVMFSIPFSILGAILALALSGCSLNIYAMLGLVMLIGLVAKNAILLVDFANDRLKEGKPIDEALVEAVRLRTRPILMTAISTIIGMIPVAVASGSSAELRNGIGWVIIGGMALSTMLTLIVVPVVYKIFHRKTA